VWRFNSKNHLTRAKRRRMENVVSVRQEVNSPAQRAELKEYNEIVFIDEKNIKHYPYKMKMIVFKDP
jgi:hypothetical protein